MSNGLPDPDSPLTPGGTPVDAVNGVLNGLNPTANGLNNGANGLNGTPTPTRKDSVEEGGPGGGQQGDGGVVKANKGMILRKSVEYIRWVCFLLGGWVSFASAVHSISGDRPHPHPSLLSLPIDINTRPPPPLYYLDTYNNS